MKLLENSYHELQGRCSGLETAFSVGDNRGTREEDIKQFRTEKKVIIIVFLLLFIVVCCVVVIK